MSVVTDVFLLTSVMFDPKDNDEDAKTIDTINKFLAPQEIKRLDDQFDAYGGSKFMQASVWVGAFNYLDVDELIELLKDRDFKGYCQLVYQREWDDGFTMVQIRGSDE